MPERRAAPRIKGPFEGYWDGAGTQNGRIVDLSVTGCFVDSRTPPAVGELVTVSIALRGSPVLLTAEVVYSEEQQGFAVRFIDLSKELSSLLEQEIAARLPR